MHSVKIAVGTSDGISVCGHLARSSAFVVFEVLEGRIASRTIRERPREGCGRHATFVEMLAGCRTVLCGGIGQGAADSLLLHGIEPVVAAGHHTVEEALSRYLAGTLVTSDERVCLCPK